MTDLDAGASQTAAMMSPQNIEFFRAINERAEREALIDTALTALRELFAGAWVGAAFYGLSGGSIAMAVTMGLLVAGALFFDIARGLVRVASLVIVPIGLATWLQVLPQPQKLAILMGIAF